MASSSDNLIQPPAKLPGAAASSTHQVPTRDRRSGTSARKRKKPKPTKEPDTEADPVPTAEECPEEEHKVNYLA